MSTLSKLTNLFNETFSVKLRCGQRVRHRATKKLGTVYQTGVVNGSFRAPAISVRYDDGVDAVLIAAEEFTSATRY